MSHVLLPADLVGVFCFKRCQAFFFLIHVFDKASSSVHHFIKSILHPLFNSLFLTSLWIQFIRLMPHIMCNKLLHPVNKTSLNLIFPLKIVQRINHSINILNQNIISRNHNFLTWQLFLVTQISLILLSIVLVWWNSSRWLGCCSLLIILIEKSFFFWMVGVIVSQLGLIVVVIRVLFVYLLTLDSSWATCWLNSFFLSVWSNRCNICSFRKQFRRILFHESVFSSAR